MCYKHKANVQSYCQQFEEQQTQSSIDQRIKEHLGQAVAFQRVGDAYKQHLASFHGCRARLPVLPRPVILEAGNMQLPGTSPLVPGIRPPVLPRPFLGLPDPLIDWMSVLTYMSNGANTDTDIKWRASEMEVLSAFGNLFT
ncbi:hypothetical protein L1049_019443 [Liquidambar formosana]|uniref:Uncharacterized protein n=1 Tax=Liquidambar formosana TaxID=63359 RepID=A0AAP0S5V7_LIQFO